MEPHNHHSSPSFINIAVLLLFAVVIAVASSVTTYFFLNSRSNEEYSSNQASVVPTPQTYVQPTSVPVVTTQTVLDETANWKTLRFSDSTGFGYEVKIPTDFINYPFGGGHSTPEPIELAQAFIGKSCGLHKANTVKILHFISSTPTSIITQGNNQLKKDGFVSSPIKIGNGMTVEKLTGIVLENIQDYYVYIPSSKGYYYITARDNCQSGIEKTFDQILSTFKFLE